MKRYGLLAAVVLTLIINAVVLAGVWFNRSGESDSAVELTERELSLSHSDKENSGISLRLNWQRFAEGSMEWFDQKKLEDVGFDCRTPVDASKASLRYAKALPRKTYAVLEYEGAAWDAWQAKENKAFETARANFTEGTLNSKELAAAQQRFTWGRVAASRLFAVDVGNDPKKLRVQYPDRSRYIITPARVRLHLDDASRIQGILRGAAKLTGSIEEMQTDTIQVPRDKSGEFHTIQYRDRQYPYSPYFEERAEEKPRPPRYAVRLNYGRRYEPWIYTVRAFK